MRRLEDAHIGPFPTDHPRAGRTPSWKGKRGGHVGRGRVALHLRPGWPRGGRTTLGDMIASDRSAPFPGIILCRRFPRLTGGIAAECWRLGLGHTGGPCRGHGRTRRDGRPCARADAARARGPRSDGSCLDQTARRRSTTKLVQRLSNMGHDVMLVPKAAWPSRSSVHFRSGASLVGVSMGRDTGVAAEA